MAGRRVVEPVPNRSQQPKSSYHPFLGFLAQVMPPSDVCITLAHLDSRKEKVMGQGAVLRNDWITNRDRLDILSRTSWDLLYSDRVTKSAVLGESSSLKKTILLHYCILNIMVARENSDYNAVSSSVSLPPSGDVSILFEECQCLLEDGSSTSGCPDHFDADSRTASVVGML